jgi:hypothetical protein
VNKEGSRKTEEEEEGLYTYPKRRSASSFLKRASTQCHLSLHPPLPVVLGRFFVCRIKSTRQFCERLISLIHERRARSAQRFASSFVAVFATTNNLGDRIAHRWGYLYVQSSLVIRVHAQVLYGNMPGEYLRLSSTSHSSSPSTTTTTSSSHKEPIPQSVPSHSRVTHRRTP